MMTKKFLSMFLALVMCLTLTAPAGAAGSETEVATEYSYAYLLPDNAENIQYLSDGTIFFRDRNECKLIDGETGEIAVFMTKHRTKTRNVAVNHVPAQLGGEWVYWRTDGPYECWVDWGKLNRYLQGTVATIEVIEAIAGVAVLPIALAAVLVELAYGGVYVDTFWEIDDAYSSSVRIWAHHVEIYMYFDEACTDLKARDYMEYEDPHPDF